MILHEDVWAIWPDDYMCTFLEIDESIQFGGRSDDYKLINVTEYDLDGVPCTWEDV